MDEEEG